MEGTNCVDWVRQISDETGIPFAIKGHECLRIIRADLPREEMHSHALSDIEAGDINRLRIIAANPATDVRTILALAKMGKRDDEYARWCYAMLRGDLSYFLWLKEEQFADVDLRIGYDEGVARLSGQHPSLQGRVLASLFGWARQNGAIWVAAGVAANPNADEDLKREILAGGPSIARFSLCAFGDVGTSLKRKIMAGDDPHARAGVRASLA